VLGDATSTVLVIGAHLCRSIYPQREEWPGRLPFPEPTTIFGALDLLLVIISRVHDFGQLTLIARFFDLLSLVRWLGAESKSDQVGPTGDLPQREASVPGNAEVQ
jgi:hypothetical protein